MYLELETRARYPCEMQDESFVDTIIQHRKLKSEALADLLIQRLNEIAKVDPTAMAALIKTRVPCNEAMRNHPTVQVARQVGTSDDAFEIGFLGMLNGIIGVIENGPRKGWGHIVVVMDHDGTFLRFERMENIKTAVGGGNAIATNH